MSPSKLYTLSLHDALPIWPCTKWWAKWWERRASARLCPPYAAGRTRFVSPTPRNRRSTDARAGAALSSNRNQGSMRSEEHTSELQSRENLVCRLLLEKKKI